MPVFMMAQAVESMAQAKEIGEDMEEQEANDLLLTIITAILFIVPVVGELGAAAAGLGRLARAFAAIGAASDFGMTIVDVVQNPEAAPMAIAGLMLGGKIKKPKEFSAAAAAAATRRGMSTAVRDGLGDVFKNNDMALSNIVKVCRKISIRNV